MMSTMSRTPRRSPVVAAPAARAFSLVELLTVIGILAIVIAIVIPAIGGARTAAKRADTTNLLHRLGEACELFRTDQKRLPGYFSMQKMATAVNADQANFMGMDNVMLDLAGGITKANRTGPGGVITVGPGSGTGESVNVDLGAMGSAASGTKTYFDIDKKFFVEQKGLGKRFAGIADEAAPTNDNELFPALVDSFGQPILAWVQNDAPGAGAALVADNAGTAAKFYLAPNAGFYKAKALGKIAEDQTVNAIANTGCILNRPAPAPLNTLTALVGDPTSPDAAGTAPASVRGSMILHSAGPNGVYLGWQERGGRAAGNTGVRYAANQDPFTGGAFDDLIQSVK